MICKSLKNLNLPEEKLVCVLMSGEYKALADEVKTLGIDVIPSVESACLPYNERYHSDMQLHNCGGKTYLLKNDCSIYQKMILEINPTANICIEKRLENNYRNNTSLNGIAIGDYFICNKRNANKEMLEWYINNGYIIIDVKQGYAACSTAVVEYNAIITDDESIYKGCQKYNIDALKISKGSIVLRGYDYGFIGGCCFKSDKADLCFFGNPKLHKDYDDIKAFCKNYSVDIIGLGNCELTDVGGVIAIL